MIEFLYPQYLLLLAALVPLTYLLTKRNLFKKYDSQDVGRQRIVTIILRSAVFAMLALAMAQPVMILISEKTSPPKITILVDNSSSMGMFDTSFVSSLESALSKELPVEVKSIASGLSSPLGESILANLEKDSSMLLVSDGQVTEGTRLADVALLANDLNATIHAIDIATDKKDASVVIIGPEKTVPGFPTDFLVSISKVGSESANLLVQVDGQSVYNGKIDGDSYVFSKEFESKGSHTVYAKVEYPGDYVQANNEFYKTIKVVDKPKVAYIGNTKRPEFNVLGTLYSVEPLSKLPNDKSALEKYHAIVVVDTEAKELTETTALGQYIADGNGMVVFGGLNSFNYGDYKNSVFETLLPTKTARGAPKRGDANIVMAIDTSGSIKHDKVSDNAVAIAINTINDLALSNRVAVLAFSERSFLISPLQPLSGTDIGKLTSSILNIEFGGNQKYSEGLASAGAVLANRFGSNNIFLIADGNYLSDFDRVSSLVTARNLAKKGIRIYVIGIGVSSANDLNFLKNLADITGGSYTDAKDRTRLNIIFGKPEEFKGGIFGLRAMDEEHFITKDLKAKPTFDSFNDVIPKEGAKLLMVNDAGTPAVTTWRYGLGRVVSFNAFSSDNRLGTLLNGENSQLFTRMINYAIGDPERKESFTVSVPDARINENVRAVVKSQTVPQTDIAMIKYDKDVYVGTISPANTGFFDFLSAKYGVSYAKEYENLGVSSELNLLVTATGGKMLSQRDTTGILEAVRSASIRQQSTEFNISWAFLWGAIILFLGDVIFRRWSQWHSISNKE